MKQILQQWNDDSINRLEATNKRQQIYIDKTCKLYVFIEKSGRKSWYCRYTENGEDKSQQLGVFAPNTAAHVGIAEAKARALKILDALEHGRPTQEANITFAEVAEKWLERYSNESRPATLKAVENRFKLYIEPAEFFNRNINDITRAEIRYLFDGLRKKPQTAKRVYSICNLIFKFAAGVGYMDAPNPMPESKYLLPKIYEQNRAAITTAPDRFGELVLKIKTQYAQEDNCAGLLLFLAYCFVRPGEARFLQWHNVAWRDKVIKLSAQETKTAAPLIIPMSQQVMELLETQKRRRTTPILPNDYIFHARWKGPKYAMCDALPGAKLRQLGYAQDEQSAHGFRSCASTYLREYLNADDNLIEMQLNHVLGTEVSRVYNKSQKLQQRRDMMQEWADWIDIQANSALSRLECGDSDSNEKVAC